MDSWVIPWQMGNHLIACFNLLWIFRWAPEETGEHRGKKVNFLTIFFSGDKSFVVTLGLHHSCECVNVCVWCTFELDMALSWLLIHTEIEDVKKDQNKKAGTRILFYFILGLLFLYYEYD